MALAAALLLGLTTDPSLAGTDQGEGIFSLRRDTLAPPLPFGLEGDVAVRPWGVMLGSNVRIIAGLGGAEPRELWFEIEGFGKARQMTIGAEDGPTLSIPARHLLRKVPWQTSLQGIGPNVIRLRFDGCEADDQGFCAAARLRSFGILKPTGLPTLLRARLRLLLGVDLAKDRKIPATQPGGAAGKATTSESPMPPQSSGASADEDPADIALILLDAARADRFGCYGHPGGLTPFADRLSRRGTLFTQAYAETPFTSASVPTLLTGLPAAVHGIIDPSLRLSDQAVTLAEKLRAKGYRTVTLSQSPNHSRSHGDGQGVDSFVELFRSPPPDAYDPAALARAAGKEASGPAPLFLMAHFIAPHEPYEPGSPWKELTGFPEESGVKANIEALRKLDRPGAEEATIAAVSALYAANLMRADAAVARLIRTLATRRPSRPALAILLADHGEAFHEHGRMGHNSTLYDEMLHIPLIFSRQERATDMPAPPFVHPQDDRLASLDNLLPTLVPDGNRESATRGLFAAPPIDRRLILRTAGLPEIRGVRTRHYKLIRQGTVRTELYDLLRDPDERRNLALARPNLALSLHAALISHLQAQRRRRLPVPAAEDDAAAKAALRALGYLE